MNLFTYEHVLSKSIEYFNGDSLAAEVFVGKYCLQDNELNYLEETPRDMHLRQAKELHRIEKNKFKDPYSVEFIFSLLDKFKYISMQGSPMYGVGNPYKFSTLSNCYVVGSPVDSYGGILKTDEEIAQLSKRRGGVGSDLSNIRPNKAPTRNSSKFATGILPYMDRYSNTTMEVGQEGRRGALMLTLADRHPQVMDFIKAKNDTKKVNGANISVRLHDDFLSAVENDSDFLLRWPIDSKKPTITNNVKAKKIWDAIIHNAWLRAEPGIQFWDRIINFNAIDCYADVGFKTISSNPCSELPLCEKDSCRLMIQNLFGYVVNPFTNKAYFDFDLFYKHAQILQRLMDDLVDLELEKIDGIINKIKQDPEDEFIKQRELVLWQDIRVKCVNGRRTGCGITALGDVFAALNFPYAQKESILLADKIAKIQKLGVLRSTVDMAKELGPFPVWDWNKEKNSQFLLPLKQEDPLLYDDMSKYGRRNIGHLTIAPTGSVSILTQTTAGVEPLFMTHYTRRKKINLSDENSQIDFIDELGQKWKHFEVYHPRIMQWMEVTGNKDITKSPWYKCTAEEIDWKNRVKLQATMQNHIDHAISSTINLPEDVTEEKVSEIFKTAWKSGCKGITVYRKNCRTGVMIDNKDANKNEILIKNNAPKRPKELKSECHFLKTKGEEYYVVVGLLSNEPYEIFTGKNVYEEKRVLSNDISEDCIVRKIKRGTYELFDNKNNLAYTLNNGHSDDNVDALTRMISTSLRHGADISFVVHQLEKTKGDMSAFAKVLSRILKKYIKNGTKVHGESCPSCQSMVLVRTDGCVSCKSCGWTKCN